MIKNTIEIDFNDEHFPANDKLIDPEVVQVVGREVSLDRPLAPPQRVYTLGTTKLYMDDGTEIDKWCTPYAFTFTFPADLVPTIREPHLNKKGVIVEGYIKTMMKDLPFSTQWTYFLKLFKIWEKRLSGKLLGRGVNIQKFDVYPEMTKQGVLHAHGLFYINSMYYSGVSDICAMTWCNVSKAKQSSQIKHNAMGKLDKAFDKCSNIESWQKYITKCYTPEKYSSI